MCALQPPILTSPTVAYVTEQQPPGALVETITFTDRNANQGHTCVKSSGDRDFNVTNDCQVITAAILDGVNDAPQRTLSFYIIDDGVPPLSTPIAVLTINVLLINTPPQMTSLPTVYVYDSTPVNGTVYNATYVDREVRGLLSFSSLPGTSVGHDQKIEASNANVCVFVLQHDHSTFSVVAGQGNRCRFPDVDVFKVNATSGALMISDLRALNYAYCRVVFVTLRITNVPVRQTSAVAGWCLFRSVSFIVIYFFALTLSHSLSLSLSRSLFSFSLLSMLGACVVSSAMFGCRPSRTIFSKSWC